MSESNVETFRRALEAFDRSDRDGWLALRHPKADALPSKTFPEADVVRGPEAIWDFYVAVTEPFEGARGTETATEFEDLGRNLVLAHYDIEVRGRASGAPVRMEYWVLVTFRDGKMMRDEWFLTRADALEAAGAEE